MIIQLSLAAGSKKHSGSQKASQVEIETVVSIDTSDPRWQSSLVETVTRQAQEGARQLVAQFAPAIPAQDGFVPLSEVARTVAVTN